MNTTNQPSIIEHISKSLNWSCNDVKWIPGTASLVALGNYARNTGTIQLFQLNVDDKSNSSVLSKSLELPEHPVPFKCATFDMNLSANDCHQFATGDYDGDLNVFDLNKPNSRVYTVKKAHRSLINAIDGAGIHGRGAPELITSSRDGSVKIWDLRQRDVPVVSLEPEDGEGVRDCWAVAFGNSYNDSDRVAVAGYDNGDVKFFDLRMNTMRWETNVKNGVCSLQFDRKEIEMNKLLVTTLEGRFFIFDTRTFHPEQGYAHLTHKQDSATTWKGAHLPQNREVFMTTGGNGTLYLYKYKYPPQRHVGSPPKGVPGTVELLSKASIGQQSIPSFDWNRDRIGLAAMSSFDQTIRVAIVTKLHKL